MGGGTLEPEGNAGDGGMIRQAASKSDKALVVIGRTAGEGKDYEDLEDSYRLNSQEKNCSAW